MQRFVWKMKNKKSRKKNETNTKNRKKNNAKQESLHQMVYIKGATLEHMLQSLMFKAFFISFAGYGRHNCNKRQAFVWKKNSKNKDNLSNFKMYKLCWWGNLKSDLYKCHSNRYENQRENTRKDRKEQRPTVN